MGVILLKSKGYGGSGGVYSQAEKLALELEMSFKAANLANFKEFIYTSGDLTTVDVYEDNTKTIKLFNKVFTYTTGILTKIVLTRISDSKKLTKDLVYNINDELESVEALVT